jgi:rubrerythrin
MFTLTDIIELAVQIEKNGESTYRRAQQATSDPFLADLLGRLADEELEHQRWFTELKSRVGTKPVDKNL